MTTKSNDNLLVLNSTEDKKLKLQFEMMECLKETINRIDQIRIIVELNEPHDVFPEINKHLMIDGSAAGEYRFEDDKWWISSSDGEMERLVHPSEILPRITMLINKCKVNKIYCEGY